MSEEIVPKNILQHRSPPGRTGRSSWEWKTHMKSIMEHRGVEDGYLENMLLSKVKMETPLMDRTKRKALRWNNYSVYFKEVDCEGEVDGTYCERFR
jgi:hypothetical protein